MAEAEVSDNIDINRQEKKYNMPTDRNTAVPDSKLLEKDDKKKDKFCQTAAKSAWFFFETFHVLYGKLRRFNLVK
jgi:hypothetical protein